MCDSIEIRDLCKSFPGFNLNRINLDLPRGSITGLIGNNGAGKTTLIKCITGAVIPDSGTITFPGQGIMKHIADVFSDCHLPREINGTQLSKVMSGIYESWNGDAFRKAMDCFGIPMDKKVKSMSTGMQKKIQIAIASAQDAQLIILDEPTSGLDPAARDEFLESVLGYIQNEDRIVLMSSHITSDLEKIADYIAFIHDGTMEIYGTKDDILDRYGILRCGNDSDLERFGSGHIVAVRRNDFGVDALVDDRLGISEAYPEAVMDRASLDDILVFMIRGERQ